MNVVFVGPPGSGKGTVAKGLVQKYGFTHISIGNALREEVAKGTPEGKEIDRIMRSGELVSVDLMLAIVKKNIAGKKYVILDGTPRTVEQIHVLEEHNIPVDVVVHFVVSDEEIITRLSGRRLCSKCHKDYHMKFFPPKQEGVCDVDQAPLIRREDDNPEVIKRRCQVFHQDTHPILAHYGKKVREVDASPTPSKVYKKVEELLANVLPKKITT